MYKVGSIGLSYMYNLFTQEVKGDNNEEFNQLRTNSNRLKILRKTLENYGGALSKVSQMLMYDDHSDSIFTECKPFSREKTKIYLENYVRDNILTYTVEDEIYKSGSMGQVHIGSLNNNKIAVKVQYTGLYEETEEDIKVLNMLVNCLYFFGDFSESMEYVKMKLYEELDYINESKNHRLISKIWKNSNIYIPKIYDKLCTTKILVTEFVDGENFSMFIQNANQKTKNKIAYDLVNFIFTNIFKHKIFYSDNHYGNLIVKDKDTLSVIDFGCLNFIEDDIVVYIKALFLAVKVEDKQSVIQILTDLEILNEKVSEESKEYAYEYFKLHFLPWVVEEEFEFTQEWFEKFDYKNIKLIKEWEVPRNFIYFNKIPHGLFHLLTALKAKCNFYKIFNDILK